MDTTFTLGIIILLLVTPYSKFCTWVVLISHANAVTSHVATTVSLWVHTHKADIIMRPNHSNRCVSSKQKPQKLGQPSADEAVKVLSNYCRAPKLKLETLQLHTSLTSKQWCSLHLVRDSWSSYVTRNVGRILDIKMIVQLIRQVADVEVESRVSCWLLTIDLMQYITWLNVKRQWTEIWLASDKRPHAIPHVTKRKMSVDGNPVGFWQKTLCNTSRN